MEWPEIATPFLSIHFNRGQYDRLVILVGNIHGIKHIVWAPEVSHNRQYLAGRLIQEGVKVFTVMQYWDEGTEQPKLISTTTHQGFGDGSHRNISAVNSQPVVAIIALTGGELVATEHEENPCVGRIDYTPRAGPVPGRN